MKQCRVDAFVVGPKKARVFWNKIHAMNGYAKDVFLKGKKGDTSKLLCWITEVFETW